VTAALQKFVDRGNPELVQLNQRNVAQVREKYSKLQFNDQEFDQV
jgi:hypothetical protein